MPLCWVVGDEMLREQPWVDDGVGVIARTVSISAIPWPSKRSHRVSPAVAIHDHHSFTMYLLVGRRQRFLPTYLTSPGEAR